MGCTDWSTGMKTITLLASFLALAACTTDFGISGEDTSTDSLEDTGADTSIDTFHDEGIDTHEDPWSEPPLDSWEDPTTEVWTDPWVDPTEDPWTDPIGDVVTDPWTDPVADAWTDPWTDTGACEPWTVPAGGTCSIVDQCGCPGGSWCYWTINETLCAIAEMCISDPMPGTVGIGQPCDYSSIVCAPGLECLDDGTGASCYQWCRSDLDCDMAGSSCSLSVGGFPGPAGTPCETMDITFPYNICSRSSTCMDTDCSPFATSFCGTGQSCTWDPICDAMVCTFTGTVSAGGSCYDQTDCMPGLECLSIPPGTMPGTCVRFCNGVHTCTGGGTCTSVGSLNHPEISVCI